MKFEHRLVPLKRIIFEDHTFCLSYPCRATNLISSIDLVGIINPPVVREIAEGYQIVCGRGRLEAAQKLGHQEVVCKVLPPWVDDLSCLSISFEENITSRGFNLVEKALVVEKFLNYLPDEEVLKHILPRLGFSSHYHQLEMLQRLNFLEEEAKELLAAEELNPKVALKLLELDEGSRKRFIHLVKDLGLSFGRQREMLELLLDLSRQEEITLKDIFDKEEIRTILEAEKLNPPQKAEKLHNYLRKKIFPHFEAQKDRVENISRRLASQGVRLKPSQAFEKDLWQIELSFRSLSELRERWPEILKELSALEN